MIFFFWGETLFFFLKRKWFFHYNEYSIPAVKKYLKENGVAVRI